MNVTINTGIRTHNERPAAVWSAGNFPTDLGICVPREYWLTVGIRI
jgi:hypothetical protein